MKVKDESEVGVETNATDNQSETATSHERYAVCMGPTVSSPAEKSFAHHDPLLRPLVLHSQGARETAPLDAGDGAEAAAERDFTPLLREMWATWRSELQKIYDHRR